MGIRNALTDCSGSAIPPTEPTVLRQELQVGGVVGRLQDNV